MSAVPPAARATGPRSQSVPRATEATLSETLSRLAVTPLGLTAAEAAERLSRFGPNGVAEPHGHHPLAILFRQFRSPMVIILLATLGAIVAAYVVATELLKTRLAPFGISAKA